MNLFIRTNKMCDTGYLQARLKQDFFSEWLYELWMGTFFELGKVKAANGEGWGPTFIMAATLWIFNHIQHNIMYRFYKQA